MTPTASPSGHVPQAPSPARKKRFVRKPPPAALQYLIGTWMDGIVAPLVWTAEKTKIAQKIIGAAGRRRERDLQKRNPLREYVPGPQDVFVMTYAKSGTNWMMQIAHQLIYHGKGEFDHLHEVVPWPDTEAMPAVLRRYAVPLRDATDWETSAEKKRVIKTHFNWDLLPYSPDARYIAVIRDPKDVFVSSYFFLQGVMGPAMPSVGTWYQLFLSTGFPLGGSWAVNAAGYWAQLHRPNVMIVSFRTMKRDLRGTVLAVADFLNIRVTDEVIDEVSRKASFGYMKNIDHKFHIGKMIPWREPGTMIRKGMQGGSSELLTPKQQRAIDEYFQAELKRLGSDFPYQEFADLAQ
jgi:hypothetical protein